MQGSVLAGSLSILGVWQHQHRAGDSYCKLPCIRHGVTGSTLKHTAAHWGSRRGVVRRLHTHA